MKTVGRIFDQVELGLKWISGMLLVAFTVLTLIQVVMRYVFRMPLSWSEQTARYLFIWMLMLYMPVIMRHGSNLGFDLIINRLPKRAQDIFWIVCELLIAAFAAFYCLYSVQLCMKFSRKILVGIGIKANWVYSAQIVGALLLCLFSVELVINRCLMLKWSDENTQIEMGNDT